MAATSTTHKSAQDHSAAFSQQQRTIALIVVALAFVMDLLDNTIVNVAIPTIQSNLGASYATIQWLIAGYSLTFALMLITGGRMGDVFGYKKVFMIGVAGFTVASLLCGVAVNSGMLIGARLLQGSMAALMVPQVISLMQVMYKPHERAAINGVFGALAGVAASLGPVVGGLLIKANIAHLSWRPIFLINVPVGIFAILMAIKYLPNGKSSHPLKLDFVGTGIVVVAMSLLVFPLIQGREAGWPLWTYVMLAASLPVFYIFARWLAYKDKKDGSALIVPVLFKTGSVRAGLLVNLLFQVAIIGFFLTNSLVLQIGLGFSAIHAALTGLPLAVGIAGTLGTLGQSVIPKLGRRAPMIGGVVMAIGLFMTSAVFEHYKLGVHSWQLIPCLFVTGFGMGFVFASLYAIVLNDVDVKNAGAASGLLNATQQVGGSIGVALIGVIFFGQLAHASIPSFQSQTPALQQQLTALHVPASSQQQIVTGSERCFHDRSTEKDSSVVPASCKQSNSHTSPQVGAAIERSALQANAANFAHAYRYGVIYMWVLLVVVFAACFALPKHFRPEAFQEA